jgi:hypothetical protein
LPTTVPLSAPTPQHLTSTPLPARRSFRGGVRADHLHPGPGGQRRPRRGALGRHAAPRPFRSIHDPRIDATSGTSSRVYVNVNRDSARPRVASRKPPATACPSAPCESTGAHRNHDHGDATAHTAPAGTPRTRRSPPASVGLVVSSRRSEARGRSAHHRASHWNQRMPMPANTTMYPPHASSASESWVSQAERSSTAAKSVMTAPTGDQCAIDSHVGPSVPL